MVQATAAQSLPPLPKFSGDSKSEEENNFNRWRESFEESAVLSGWTQEQKLFQLTIYLDKTTLQVFRMMPEAERTKHESAVASMKKKFWRVDIKELRGLQFCHKLQGDESLKQLGMELQQTARRAFHSVQQDEFNRLLKGHFF